MYIHYMDLPKGFSLRKWNFQLELPFASKFYFLNCKAKQNYIDTLIFMDNIQVTSY